MDPNEGPWVQMAPGSFHWRGTHHGNHLWNSCYPNTDALVNRTTDSEQGANLPTPDNNFPPLDESSLGANELANLGLVRRSSLFPPNLGCAQQGLCAHPNQLYSGDEAAVATGEFPLANLSPLSTAMGTGNAHHESNRAIVPFGSPLDAPYESGEYDWLAGFLDSDCFGRVTSQETHQNLDPQGFPLLSGRSIMENEINSDKRPIILAWDSAGEKRPLEVLVGQTSSTTCPGSSLVATDPIC